MDAISFAPLLAWPVVGVFAALAALFVLAAAVRGLRGWPWRALAGLMILAALANPQRVDQDVASLPDIVFAVVDRSASQTIATRPAQTDAALADLRARVAALPNTTLQVITVDGLGADAGGTALMAALSDALANVPRAQVAGVFILSDGHVHDMTLAPDLPAPTHLVMTGQPDDWDRRLVVKNAPAFAILGEPVEITVRIDDSGAAPGDATADLILSVDGGADQVFSLPVGRDMAVRLQLPHGGMNVLQLSTPTAAGEITDRNNGAILRINGLRDRLRVLLVSGEPHAGERTWRNLLKSDTSVDLIHFTILRPPGKFDNAPLNELALIAFPTRELFLEKIDDFDLIIFDRYRRRGLLPSLYFQNIADYVRGGGAVLVSAGPDYAGPDSLYRSPLGAVLPGAPTARVIEQGVMPVVSDLGQRHPITENLAGDSGPWGRWMRQIEVEATSGDVILTGHDDLPLLIADRVGDGRVALLASDHAWLWDRGFEGGGPQRELLRRLSHWMMKEPELEEEALWAEELGSGLRIIRRTLADTVPDDGVLTFTAPDGTEGRLQMTQTAPGRWEAALPEGPFGLYRFQSGDVSVVGAMGPPFPKEFAQTVATDTVLRPLVDARQGGVVRISDGLPRVRTVREGRPAAGRGWLGITPRGAEAVQATRLAALLPGWAWLLLSAGFMVFAWLREGRADRV